MKAIVVERWVSGMNELQVANVPDPKCAEDGVVIRIHAIGLNFFEYLMVQRKYQVKPALPFIPGSEMAGVIIEAGPKVKGFKVGDRVFGTGPNNIGCFAELVAVKATPGLLFHIPGNLTFAEAASLFMTYPTSWLGLDIRGQLKKDEVCLVHAAAGGVGIAAVQIAKSLGAIVIATAGSDAKCAIAKEQGADYVINYNVDKDWVKTVNAITSKIPGRTKKGADVIYDPASFAGTGDAIEAVPANRLLLKGASLVGVFWGGSVLNDRAVVPKTWKGVFELFSKPGPNGKPYKPVIYTDYAYKGLESVPKALQDLADRKTYGKVVVELGSTDSKL
ncbi:hypothetical protein HDV05_003917 [Chytridiales sp. JEL 0842]|nr:hypothetical protein HDV05_003917 [Chytridiales sp. JEL 0842]